MELRERGRGMMVGIGVGNLLGIPYEGSRWDADSIHDEFGNEGIREIEARPGYPDDDDLAQAIVLAEACAESESLDLDDFVHRLWIWGEINGAGMGPHTKRTLSRYGGDRPRRALRNYARYDEPPPPDLPRKPHGVRALDASRDAWRESRERHSYYNAGNGAVMRCAPVALRWVFDDAAIVRNSIVSAAATHWDPRCTWSAALVNLAAASCLRGEAVDAEHLILRAQGAIQQRADDLGPYDVEAEPPAEVAQAVRDALADGVAIGELDIDHPASGYVIKILKAALWAARHPADFEDGLSAVVSAGGDMDTNGAAAGAVLGARFGLDAIPERWRVAVDEIRDYTAPIAAWQPRQPLEGYADRLLAASSATD